jgi:hypothetical protein
MLRYIATRLAHEKNPYPPHTPEWESYNKGFISTSLVTLPSIWEVLLMLCYLSPAIVIAAGIAVWAHLR